MQRFTFRISTALIVFASAIAISVPYVVKAAESPTFSTVNVATNLTVPVAMQFSPDGRIYVAEKYGDIKVIDSAGGVTDFGSIAVNGDFEQGLLGFVLDPNFANNGYIYVAYTRPDGDNNRVSRITATVSDRGKMQPGSEIVLLDNIPSSSGIHQMGDMHVGLDGKLYIAAGDGALEADVSHRLDTLAGKFLRINLDGSIPADNPFVGQAGARGEIWAYGLRNPFSSGLQKSTGRIFLGDVGNDTWEEINELQKGANYGWRQCEGKCQPARPGYTDPFYQYNHYDGPVVGRSITAGTFYEGGVYPADFQGDYLFADYVAGWIKRIDTSTKVVSSVSEGFGGVVNMKVGPDGLVYVVQLDVNTGAGTIKKIAYGSDVTPPTNTTKKQLKIYAAGSSAAGQFPTMEVLVNDIKVATHTGVQGNHTNRQFTEYVYEYSGELLPGQVKLNFSNDLLTATEDRNLYIDKIILDGVTYESESAETLSTGTWAPSTNCAPGNKTSEVLSCSGYFQYGKSSAIANQNPVANIVSPAAEAHYNAGNVVSFSGTASDPEDGILNATNVSWKIVFHHATHSHPFLDINNTKSGSFTIPDTGEAAADTFYRLQMTATDSQGQSVTSIRDIYPNTVKVSLLSNVPGALLDLDGSPRTTPLSFDAVTGFKRTLNAPISQVIDGKTYDFVSWSDGGAATHTITTPAQATGYQANYKARDGTVTPAPTTPKSSLKIYAAGTPAQNIYPTMELQINGQTVSVFQDIRGDAKTRQFIEYTYVSDAVIDPGSVRLNYPNDALINGEDRNLHIDKISINGTVYETEAPGTLSTGTWTPTDGCQPGNKQSEVLACGGYFQFSATTTTPAPDTQGSTISIYAAGSAANGIYPTMDLKIDEKIVKTYPDIRGNPAARQFMKYDYVSPTKLTLGQLQIEFSNDALINNEDRNLHIDKIILDGLTFESESPKTFSRGSWTAATGCSDGYKSSEVLSCNGFLKYY